MNAYAVINPATGATEKTFPTMSTAELDAAINLADKVYRTWSRTTTVDARAALIRRVGELYVERSAELADVIVREMGKPRNQAVGEVRFSASIYAYYADNAAALLADEPIELKNGSGSALIRKQPIGVLLGIMPWNFPYYQVARFSGPNLMLGNTILLKHAPQCPESAAAMEHLFQDAGFPRGAYVNIYAANEQIEHVIADPRVQGVSVTGSQRAGAAVAQLAGKYLKKVVLELGGSDPFLLLSTDDMAATVKAAVRARMNNSGQACNAAKRFIVIDKLYDDFVQKFTAAMAAIAPADPTVKGTVLGPLSSATATERLSSQVRRAVDGGAHLTGAGHDGNYFRTGVLTGVKPDNEVYREELFGPVASVFRVGSEDEAVKLANDTQFGLGSYVFTTDPEQARRVADALEAGMVCVNIVGAESAELPFGGVKQSGFGRELGRLGAGEFVNRKMIRIG